MRLKANDLMQCKRMYQQTKTTKINKVILIVLASNHWPYDGFKKYIASFAEDIFHSNNCLFFSDKESDAFNCSHAYNQN